MVLSSFASKRIIVISISSIAAFCTVLFTLIYDYIVLGDEYAFFEAPMTYFDYMSVVFKMCMITGVFYVLHSLGGICHGTVLQLGNLYVFSAFVLYHGCGDCRMLEMFSLLPSLFFLPQNVKCLYLYCTDYELYIKTLPDFTLYAHIMEIVSRSDKHKEQLLKMLAAETNATPINTVKNGNVEKVASNRSTLLSSTNRMLVSQYKSSIAIEKLCSGVLSASDSEGSAYIKHTNKGNMKRTAVDVRTGTLFIFGLVLKFYYFGVVVMPYSSLVATTTCCVIDLAISVLGVVEAMSKTSAKSWFLSLFRLN